MPLISVVGRRSASTRILLTSMYVLLVAGALTMIYPFALMMTTATTSRADYQEFRLIPRFWHNDSALFKKYIVDAAPADELATWFGRDKWFEARDIRLRELEAVARIPEANRRAITDDWREFVKTECPDEFKIAMFEAGGSDTPVALKHEYVPWLIGRFGPEDTLAKVGKAYDYIDPVPQFSDLGPPRDLLNQRAGRTPARADLRLFITSRAIERQGVLNLDTFAVTFIRNTYGSVERLTEQTGFDAASMTDVTWHDIVEGRLGARAKRDFFVRAAPFRFVTIDVPKAREAWKQYLHDADKDATAVLTQRIPEDQVLESVWNLFVQKRCPLEALGFVAPDPMWWDFLRQKYRGDVDALNAAHGADHRTFQDARMSPVLAVAIYDDFHNQRAELRRRYLSFNFTSVIKFVTVHGYAMQVTAVYIVLLIGTTLTVNPLAAYALSRFRLRETHTILLFLLATMAFPGEVLMIPNLLLIKAFPIWQILVIAGCLACFIALRMKLGRRLPVVPAATIAFAVTALLAGYVLPKLAAKYDARISVSLMNTFFALILPAMANGYGIFLLKGFFDSLPPELYEAGLIDGASEMRMLWQITLPLCKPILAVMALGAFTAAYGAFMHAFLVCQDPKMWTLMVFLYQFQQQHGVPMIMASLVIAAVPTLIVFIMCQRVILRGIVIPTFK